MGNICILMILFNLLIYVHFLFYSLLFQTRYRNRIKDEVKAIANSSSIVHFYFDSLGATKYERDKLFGTLDLIGKQFEISMICGFQITQNVIFQPHLEVLWDCVLDSASY